MRLRASVLATVREFFAARGVLEVETPLLGAGTVTDVHLESFELGASLSGSMPRFLQTSPEFAMKRLLAAGSGAIYQICKAFRAAEAGALHNPEFSVLEWYRPGWDHHALMGEVEALLREVLGRAPGRRLTYRQAFLDLAGIDALTADLAALRDRCRPFAAPATFDRDTCLDLLLEGVVQPGLGEGIVFVVDFPASQAALARVRRDEPPVAERFEVFVSGIEVGNGYHELTDPAEQAERFERDRQQRRARGLRDVPGDPRLVAALRAGLPACAGVAIGLDRLIMLAGGFERLDAVLSFPFARA